MKRAETSTNRIFFHSKKTGALFPGILCAALAFFGAAPVLADDTAAVQAVVEELFDAMREKDAGRLQALFLPEARLGTRNPEGWISNVGSSTAMLDEVTYDETIMIDGDLAMAWTPYTLYVDDVLHHCGVDVFVMQRAEGAWKILQLNDTRRTEDCSDPRGR